MGPEILPELAALFTILRQLPGLVKRWQQSDARWELENNVADLRMKVRGHIAPVIIERLDDGTDPAHQRLGLDLAPRFSEERIAGALRYWPTQSWEIVMEALVYEIAQQAWRDAQPGEERTSAVTLDIMRGVGEYTMVLHGHAGNDWQVVSDHKVVGWRRLFANAWEMSKIKGQMREEAKQLAKAAKQH
jgi:hypothetical protein